MQCTPKQSGLGFEFGIGAMAIESIVRIVLDCLFTYDPETVHRLSFKDKDAGI